MLAVHLSEQEIQPFLSDKLSLAVINGPTLCVVSGETTAVQGLADELTKKEVGCHQLHTSHAFHSIMMEPILEAFTARVGQVRPKPPQIPFVSNVTGTWISSAEATNPGYWAQHLRQTVRFYDCVQALLNEPSRVLLEVGPGQTLSMLARQHPNKTKEQLVLASTRHPKEQKSDVAFIMTNLEHPWFPPPIDLTLLGNDVHVWRANLNQPVRCVQQLAQTLSADERFRAGRFHFEQDSRCFIVGRGVLRATLARYVGIEPSQLQFCYGAQGKPYLAESCGGGTLRFNLAHSHQLALYAFARGRQIGIDLERVQAEVACEQIAARLFSPRECGTLRTLPATVKQKAFFDCWTRKEAYLKARGEGLSLPLDQIDVSLAPEEPAMLLNVRGDSMEASRWSLQELMPGPGYVATLAVAGHGWRLACWEWSG